MSHDNHHQDPELAARRSPSLSIVASGEVKRGWRSIEERETPIAPAEVRAEFPAEAEVLDGVGRRDFMALLGASMAVTGVACTRPRQPIVPYVRRPVEVTPGNPLNFATAHPLEGYARGLIVESHAGRPTKVEGNPDHPDSLGATSVYDQGLTLGLYDAARLRQLVVKGQPAAWVTLLRETAKRSAALAVDGGAKLRFLVEPSTSPLIADLRTRLLERFPKAKFVSYSPVASDGEAEGARLAFGRPLEPRHDLTKAAVIVSLDSNFLVEGPESVRLHRQYSAGRAAGPNMNRLYVVEPTLTSTGSLADHRLRVRGSDVLAVAQALVSELARGGAGDLGSLAALPASGDAKFDTKWVAAVARDLIRTRGRCVVMAGRRQPAAVHALVNAMNAALGNIGATVNFGPPVRHDPMSGPEGLRTLVEEIAAGVVDTLVITARNPAYSAPVDFKLDQLLPRVPNSYYLALHHDETAGACNVVMPAAHLLEMWGDARAVDGTVSIVQPLISPLWSGTTEADVLAAFLGEGDRGAYQLLRTFWQKRAAEENWADATAFDSTWEMWLARGVIPNSALAAETGVALSGGLAGALGPLLAQREQEVGGLEIAFSVDPKIFDGRFANNAWLQEIPHPITKITWDNAVMISQTTATREGVKTGDIVRVELGDRQVSGPVYVQPGQADDSLTIALGYGRTGEERTAVGVGFNAYALRTSTAPWFARGAKISKKAGRHRFGITQDHWRMEDRDPAKSTTLADVLNPTSPFYKSVGENDAKTNRHIPLGVEHRRGMPQTLIKPVDYSDEQYKWGMSIDLSRCSGCNACVIACQSENNIPVVGRENVRVGREMHWLRIDRYYEGSIEDPEVITQPMACVHCETAPCEYVCPVNATVHSDEGLNEMVYNRCIGTRYCSNNCPYKVRRFNFLDYHGDVPAVRKMAANPDVTVRSRGVMEKCTYCVQRIERARIDARVEGRMIADDEIQTACQQGCPGGAIVFGNLNDPDAKVSRLHADARRYDVLHDLGTRPRTAYLARVRNPNPEMA